jgi:hypothetical protein
MTLSDNRSREADSFQILVIDRNLTKVKGTNNKLLPFLGYKIIICPFLLDSVPIET